MELTPILIIGFLVLGTYKMTELFVRRKERLIIIEKLSSLANLESAGPIRLPNILYQKQDFGSWPLRISSLLVGIGVGCLVTFFSLVYYKEYNLDWDLRNILIFASISLFGGLGLFIAFMIELNQKNKQSNRDNN